MKIAKAKQCAICHEEQATMCILANKVQICQICYDAIKIDMIIFRVIRFIFMGKVK